MPLLPPLLALAATVVLVPAPVRLAPHVGADAIRFEVERPTPEMSRWYVLSYREGDTGVAVHEHAPASTRGPETDIARSADVAWHVARVVLGTGDGLAHRGERPAWATAHTGAVDGSSAGLLFTLADVDLLTAGRLAGDLRVAATGTIGSDGVVTTVRMVDAKVAAARLAGADVVFAPDFDGVPGPVGAVAADAGALDAAPTIGEWLDTAGYEAAGRRAPPHALVPVDDVRQALAWLCGRTGLAGTCTLAHAAAAVPPSSARPYRASLHREVSPVGAV